jgi:hypothetical protein
MLNLGASGAACHQSLSKICRNYIALEKENQRLSAELDDLRHK